MTKTVLVLLLLSLTSCQLFDKKKPDDDPPPPVTIAPTVPPQTYNGTPVAAFGEAGVDDGKTPLDQARAYEASGQLWLARLVLEPKALGSDGTKEEAELLGSICARQGDADCVDRASKRAGHKIAFDAGAPGKVDVGMHAEPDNDAAKARAMLLKGDLAGAHQLLEPKVIGGAASKEEIRLLRTVCKQEGEQQKMCVALCDSKLK
ncbi:MAG TPA: hypothetical protein VIF62_25415 [Labilithrix sp.]